MRPPPLRTAALAVALLAASPANPCSICSAGDPLIAASDAPSQPGALRFSLDAEALTAAAASDHEPGTRDRVDQRTLRLVTVYGPTERLNLVLTLPWSWKETRTSGGGLDERSSLDGPGDVEVAARWFAWRRTDWGRARRQAVALSAGTSLPTGPADARGAGIRLDDHAQVGTGGWGPYGGVLYRLQQLEWSFFASATARWRSENRWGFRYGAALTWTVQGHWQPTERLALGLGVDGRQAAPDTEHGDAVSSTGGLVLAASPGLWLSATDDLWLSLRAQVPFTTALPRDQRVGPVLTAGVQWIAR